ncbi:MAG: guanylate kinase [Elusimicrobiales bacterium]|nr:guanylate kinase [Elusimicrobiales bacterium]
MSDVFPLVISSPSGGGKTTVKNRLLKNDIFEFSITCTTRNKRNGEIDGIDYYFLTNEEFDLKIKNNEFLEWAFVHGKRYGTLKKTIEDILLKNKIPVMTIDVVGALNVKKTYPNSLLIFIIPPNLSSMIERLKKRGEPEHEIENRLFTAFKEVECVTDFDYIIINDKIENTVESILLVVNAHKQKYFFKKELIENFKKELKEYLSNRRKYE